jgi:methionyl-tRNA formyltransferase
MRFGFVTCVRLGLACMETIHAMGGRLDLVVTLPDDVAPAKSGRVRVDDFCASGGIDLVKTPDVNSSAVLRAVADHGIDWLFVIGWSQVVRPPLLRTPRRGVLGMHPTLLPQGRGRAAIPWAILKGLSATGVTLFQLDEGIDTGPIVAQHVIPLGPQTTATELYAAAEAAHSRLLADAWAGLVADRLTVRAQDPAAGSWWPARRPEDGELTPDMTVEHALRLVRATTRPYPGAYWSADGRRLRVWAARRLLPGAVGPGFRLVDGAIEATEFDFICATPPRSLTAGAVFTRTGHSDVRG